MVQHFKDQLIRDNVVKMKKKSIFDEVSQAGA